MSANSRDVRKGYFAFKKKMLKYEKEIMYGVPCHNQLKRVDSLWVSAIMKPESRSKNRKFVVDVDTKDPALVLKARKILDRLGVETVLEQETKNGYHWMVPPFDKTSLTGCSFAEVKTDALFFVEHIQGNQR